MQKGHDGTGKLGAEAATKRYEAPRFSGNTPRDPMTGFGPSARAGARTMPVWIFDRALTLAAIVVVLVTIAGVVKPMFANVATLGGHDWDQMEAHRWLVVKSIREFHQFPFWNPYACGGFSAWGAVESDTIIVSPFLPVYLFAPLAWAIRIEVLGGALLSALGTWLLAGRFTRSSALRALVCVVFAVDGRWSLQAATGHAWHLYYAYTPWVLYFYDRAARRSGPTDFKSIALAAVFVAMMVYSGAIYPLPETALLVAIYAVALAVARRSMRPVAVGTAIGALAAGLAAPKLVSLIENVARWPRIVESLESIDLHAFMQMLTEQNQDTTMPAAAVPQWGWHEYGLYVGWLPCLLILVGLILAKGERARALRWAALAGVILGFGHFHDDSPWALLHELPLFKSQHVPTRWLYPAVLLCAAVAASSAERALVRTRLLRRPLEIGLVVMVLFIGRDIAEVARRPLTHAFWMQMRPVAPAAQFHMEYDAPANLQYVVGDYAPPALPAMLAGIGVLRCSLHPGLNIFAPAPTSKGRPFGMGAFGKGEPEYRGEAYLAEGKGTANIVSFTPNRVEVEFAGAEPGDLLVLNQNWDAGWEADGKAVVRYRDTLGAKVSKPGGRIVFRYRARFIWLTTALAVFILGAMIAHGAGATGPLSDLVRSAMARRRRSIP
jgi:hypothetical protein